MWTPHQHALPELAPYPGQVERALHLVHERRRRTLAVAAAAGIVIFASLLSASGVRFD